jgi:acyl-CoA synthetase (AMP-forming)/AMP-acid ligase II
VGYRLRKPSPPSTLVELLRQRATQHPDSPAFTLLNADGQTEQNSLTYGELDERARAIGEWLRSTSAGGERVLLLHPPGSEFVTAFFGCLYAGATAVPAYSLDIARMPQLEAVIQDARPSLALTTHATVRRASEMATAYPYLKSIRWVSTEIIPDERSKDWQSPGIDKETLALLQYTSGSTSAPAGVMMSHGNVLANISGLDESLTGHSTYVNWMPLAHTGGLMGIMAALYAGARWIQLTPESFLQKPVRWLKAISHFRATISAGSPFAYQLCVGGIRAEERDGLDLGSWRVASIGAEPLDPSILDRFATLFGPCGFRRDAFVQVYGLTEGTGAVSSSPGSRELTVVRVRKSALQENKVVIDPPEDATASRVASCGMPIRGERIVIVEPNTGRPCRSDQVGEIWISGSNVARGYWRKPAETHNIFEAFLSDSHDGPYLRTGDLGFVHGGELFITGRLKELIILRGLNHYPHDLELTVAKNHKALRLECTIAFSAPTPAGERLVLVQELKDGQETAWDTIISSIRETVFNVHGVLAHAVVLVKPGTILKTPSGKIQRNACRAAYLEGKLQALKTSIVADDTPDVSRGPRHIAARTPTERKLAEIWSAILGVEKIGIYENFLDLGGHSILTTECLHLIRDTWGVELSPDLLFTETANVRELADVIDRLRREGERSPESLLESAQSSPAGDQPRAAPIDSIARDPARMVLP